MTERELLTDCLRRLNEAYLRFWADHLGVRMILEEVLRGQPPPKPT